MLLIAYLPRYWSCFIRTSFTDRWSVLRGLRACNICRERRFDRSLTSWLWAVRIPSRRSSFRPDAWCCCASAHLAIDPIYTSAIAASTSTSFSPVLEPPPELHQQIGIVFTVRTNRFPRWFFFAVDPRWSSITLPPSQYLTLRSWTCECASVWFDQCIVTDANNLETCNPTGRVTCSATTCISECHSWFNHVCKGRMSEAICLILFFSKFNDL